MGSITTTPNNVNYNAQYCLHRLPCGYCTMLNRLCPMMGTQYEPVWKPEITCQTGGVDNGN